MYNDFLELFGIDLVGLDFERAFWLLCIVFAGWGIVSGIAIVRDGDKADGALRIVLSVAGIIWTGYYAIGAWFSPGSYQLFFEKELVLHTYAVAIVTGFLGGTWIAAREGGRVGIPPGKMLDLAFWSLIAGLVGARLLFILVSVGDYVDACFAPEKVGLGKSDCTMILRFWEGGLVFYGPIEEGQPLENIEALLAAFHELR